LETVLGSGKALANLTLFIFFAVLLFAIMGVQLTLSQRLSIRPCR
jgi:hypothetical protein